LFGYTGRAYDNNTGLQNNTNRWYDSKVGSWISRDPTGFNAGDGNLYRYVGNSPVNESDPTGLMPQTTITLPDGVTVTVPEGGNYAYYEDGTYTIWDKYGNIVKSSYNGDICIVTVSKADEPSTFFQDIQNSTSGQIVYYKGDSPGPGQALKFNDHLWTRDGNETRVGMGEIKNSVESIKTKKQSVLILGACQTMDIEKPLGQTGKISAIIGTNRSVNKSERNELVSLFLAELRQGKTIYEAVNEANKRYDNIHFKGNSLSIERPELSCSGPDINKTLQQIQNGK
jgi:RHS repeat-associated protein